MKYVISAREFSGTSTQVVAQLNELIEALMAVRLALERESAVSLRPPLARARAAQAFLVLEPA